MYVPLEFWERVAPAWIKRKKNTRKDLKLFEEFVNPDWSVLELGCGTGRWANYFKHYTGTDISPSLVVHAKRYHPTKQFFHHDMRYPVPNNWDLIFTFTAWLHVPPADIAKVKLPDCNYLFIEPHGPANNEYCFQHDLPKLFGVKAVKTVGPLTVYARIKS